MACTNQITTQSPFNIPKFGFTTVFNPYLKTVTFDAEGLIEIVDAFGCVAGFQVTDTQGNIIGDIDQGLDDLDNETSYTINLTTGGVLFYGKYHIKAKLNFAEIEYIEFDVNVCFDERLETTNFIKGCISVETNCSTARMIIKEQTNFKYNGLSPVSKSYSAVLTYPDNYIEQKTFTNIPYSVSLDGAITGLYQIKVTTTARYELDACGTYIDVAYITRWAKEVSCAGALSTLMCCWANSLDVAEKGGVLGAQMEEKLQEAAPYYNMALLQEFNGVNSEEAVNEVQKILGCDCKCQPGVTIQANPITLGVANVTGACAATVTTDGNGDIQVSVQAIEIEACDETQGVTFEKTVDSCTKTWCMRVNFAVLQQQVLNSISQDSDYVNNWKTILGIASCPCKTSVIWMSQDGEAPSASHPLVFSQITACNGNVITFSPQTVTTIQGIVDYLNSNGNTDDYGVFSLSPDGTGIVSSHVPTTGSCVIIVYLYQNCTTAVIVNGTPVIMSVNRLSDYHNVLAATYFVRADIVESIELKDTTVTIGTIIVSESTTGGSATSISNGDEYTLDAANQCGSTLIAKTGTLTQEVTNVQGCKDTEVCSTSYERVEFSERYTSAYRYNPQINDLPYYGDYIYINNIGAISRDTGSVVRRYDTVTKETITIAGKTKLLGTPTTLNNVWCDVAEYYFMSSVYVDKSDISNGQPAIYFVTFGGVFCKIVRERSTECDERANWKNYILAGANSNTLTANPQTGANARFMTPYGSKRFGTINGQPSFLVYNQGAGRIDFLYYVSGTVNAAASWNVVDSEIADAGQININNESPTLDDVPYTNIPTIYQFYGGGISKWYYIGSLTSLSDITDSTKYEKIDIISQALGQVDGLASTVARVNNPMTLSKITYDGRDTFVFSEEYTGGGIPVGNQKLRGFYESSSPGIDPTDFTFITVVADNTQPYSSFGYANTGIGTPGANGVTFGIFWHPVKSKYFEFPSYGGVRQFCPNQAVVEATILYEEESGADGAGATEQDLTTGIVDTNFQLVIDCGE